MKKTPLHARHIASGAKMTEIAGWEMPLEFSGAADEHGAVRSGAGVFDVSHLGELELAGKDALAAIQKIFCNDASVLRPGQAQYSAILSDAGTVVDDVILYRLKSDHFMIVTNAANVIKDYNWIAERLSAFGDAVVFDASSRYGVIAVQGPSALSVVQPLTGVDLGSLKRFDFAHGEFANVRGTISRTGFTGGDGFEIFVPPQQVDRVWQSLVAGGAVPCGSAAAESLRVEAGLKLYGKDFDDTTTAADAGLAKIVKRKP